MAGRIGPGRLTDERGQLGALDGTQEVDDALGVRLLRPDFREVGRKQVRDDDPAAVVDLRPLERPRQQLQLRELDRLVDTAEDALDVDAGLEQLGSEPKRLRRRVRVLKAPRVGDERDVDRLGELRRQRHAQLGEQVAHDLAGRRGVGDDAVDLAEARVVVVVVDVDDERAPAAGHRRRGPCGWRSRSRQPAARVRRCRPGAPRARGRRAAGTRTRPGSGTSPDRNMVTSLPSARSAIVVASSEPSASPSGFSWVATRKRSCSRIASATRVRSGFVIRVRARRSAATCARRARRSDRIRRSASASA